MGRFIKQATGWKMSSALKAAHDKKEAAILHSLIWNTYNEFAFFGMPEHKLFKVIFIL